MRNSSMFEMAHSHVQRRLREAMELDCEELVEDADRDYVLAHETAAVYVTVHGRGHLAKVWSPAVRGLPETKPVLREVNAANARLTHARVHVQDGTLFVTAMLPIPTLVASHLCAAVVEVGHTAHSLGQMLAMVHGGHLMHPDAVES